MKTLFERVFAGNDEMYALAVKAVDEALAKLGPDAPATFGDTAYSLPCLYAMTGKKVATVGEAKEALETTIKDLMTRNNRTKDIFTSGVATALSAEMIELMKWATHGGCPYEEPVMGHFTDAQVRELGVPLVTRDIPGVAVIIGAAPSAEEGVELVKEYQSQGIFVTLVGGIIDQCIEKGVKLGFNVRCVALGRDLSSVAHVVSVALRAAIIFGSTEPGNYEAMWRYTMDRVFAFVNAYAPVDDMTVACGAGAIQLGFPVITNDTEENNMFRVPKSLIIQEDTSKFNATSLEARDIKIKITKIDIPVAFSSAFEGEIIRRGDMQVEFDGSRVDALELVRSKELSEVEDHKFTLIGPDLDSFAVGSKNAVCFIADVAGKNMSTDFESVFERKFHAYVNCMEGVMHTGQRDMIRVRVSKAAFEAGLRLKDFAEVLYAKLKSDYDAVIDKCQITIITDPEECKKFRHEVAIPAYDKRDERLQSLTDENVDQFYTCIMCQSFSPSHVCIVTPERLGLCGAVSWLDAKATNELDPSGPCQVVPKAHVIDENVGRWEEVNEAVNKYSQGALESVTLYSIMEDPMTSCGSEMASMTGGGVQTPGFMGHGKHFIASKKFMKAEGGLGRIVWMPKALKEQVAERVNQSAKELYGIDNFCDMVGDETIAEDPETLMAFLSEKGHPALSMDPLM